jgi:glutamyl-tRNA synthetase
MKKIEKQIRVRFAPSPTGWLHIGGLRTALYNYLFARRHNGVFFLRLEDTDQKRLVPGAVEGILRTLQTMGIEPDEGPRLQNDKIVETGERGPYLQSKRLKIYQEQAEKLIAEKKAYYCFCTEEELETMRDEQMAANKPTRYDGRCRRLSEEEVAKQLAAGKSAVVRLAVPNKDETEFDDLIRGRISIKNSEIDDCVLLKSDGFPTYHLAVVIDDHLMETTHVIRGEEWISSVPKHILLYRAFGWNLPEFAHLPHLLNPDRSKLSKRQGDVSVEDFLKKGYLPEALINFVALLGWNPSADREIFTLEELAKNFDIGKVNKSGAIMNIEKLDWLNRNYSRELDPGYYARAALPFLIEAKLLTASSEGNAWYSDDGRRFTLEDLIRVIELERERSVKFSDLSDALVYIFEKPAVRTELLPWKNSNPAEAKERLRALADLLAKCDFESAAELEEKTKKLIAERNWSNGEVLWPLRVALTGRDKSPGPFEVAFALGKEETIDRIKHAIKWGE